ncbi:MAG TPA: DUF305 domain-containing protein [bacterium]|nr:DUF305 domain-containing protein [bacterium]
MQIAMALAILILATSAAAGNPTAPASGSAFARLSGLSGQAFDIAFLRSLVPVDEEAVEMAMTATLYADHTDLLRWNQDFVERENGQVRQMLSILQAMGASPTERRAGVTTKSVKTLRALRGAALERAYLPMLAAQLDQTSRLARLASDKSGRPEVRALARQALTDGSNASAVLRGWLKTWY